MWFLRGNRAKHRETGPRATTSSPVVGATPTGRLTASLSGPTSIESNPYEKYGLGSPPKGNRSRSLDDAQRKLRADGLRKYLRPSRIGSEKTKMLVFLYGRGFMADSNKRERLSRIKKMIEQEDASERLMRILEADGDRDVTATNMALYVNNCLVLRHYFEQEGAFGFLPSMSETKDHEYFFRIQQSGNCFLQAPCVMMAYLEKKHDLAASSPVDVSKFVRHSFSDDNLYNYVVKDCGGSSLAELKTILEPWTEGKPRITVFDNGRVRGNSFDLEAEMAKCGPGLVAEFDVHKNFHIKSLLKECSGKIGYIQFDGQVKSKGSFVELKAQDSESLEEKDEIEVALQSYMASEASRRDCPPPRKLNAESTQPGRSMNDGKKDERIGHAMVLVGGRRDNKSKKKWLHFQNWWEDMQLIEVSDEYFKNAGGCLAFVDNQLIDKGNATIESCYSINRYRVAECNNLDKPEDPTAYFRSLPRERAR